MSLPHTSIHHAPSNTHSARPCANFHPTIWGDIFLQYDSESSEVNDNMKQQVEIHKEEVKEMLLSSSKNVSHKLSLIDTIQRLGVSHHFEREIDETLEQIHNSYANNSLISKEGDLHFHALLFRLLRQKGYHISPDIFNQFKNDEGKFNQIIAQDVQGMWSLYEAAQLRVHGEDILDEALDFTYINLLSMTNHQLSSSLAAQINQSLREPLYKKVPRIEARHYLSLYEEDPSHNKTLLTFAKLDFNILQKLHQKEIGSITKWWKNSEFATKVSYARDRVVEAYFWPLAMSSEPKHSTTRRIMGKMVLCISLLDDTYDAFGTLEELELFTQAFERWDTGPIESLPKSFRVIFNAIVDLWDEIDKVVAAKGENSSLVLQHLKQALFKLAQSYLEEAKWRRDGYIPTYDEYKVNGTVSSTCPLQIATFVGIGQYATKEVFDWILSDPTLIKAPSVMGRLMNDLASYKFEQKRDRVASAVECCMKQYGISQEKANKLICEEVINLWKDINEAFLKSDDNIPKPLRDYMINVARVVEFTYANFEDRYTNGELMKGFVVALLLDPIVI